MRVWVNKARYQNGKETKKKYCTGSCTTAPYTIHCKSLLVCVLTELLRLIIRDPFKC